MLNFQVIITDLGEIGENAIIVFEENVGVGAEEIVANQEYVTYTGDSEEVLEVKINNKTNNNIMLQFTIYTDRPTGIFILYFFSII